MRKRRRLADKLTIMVCAVLVAVSAFFYAPMDVSASSANNYDYVVSGSDTSFTAGKHSSYWQSKIDFINDDLIDDAFYLVRFDYKYEVSSQKLYNLLYAYGSIDWKPILYLNEREGQVYQSTFLGSDYFVMQGRNFESLVTISFDNVLNCEFDTVFNYVFSFNINSITQLTGEESSSYQQGYNAGYSAGEQAGYGSGYSDGYSDGEKSIDTGAIYDEAFQAGKDSVNTDSYYDAGYQAGYQVAYQEGYDNGYDEGYQSVMDRIDGWGADTTDYPLLLLDKPLMSRVFDIFVKSSIPTQYSDFGEWTTDLIYNPNHTYRFNVVLNPTEYKEGSADIYFLNEDIFYLNVGGIKYRISNFSTAYVNTFFVPGDRMSSAFSFSWEPLLAVMGDTYDSGTAYCYYDLNYQIYDMGPSGDTQNHIANQTDSLTNGFNDSHGNSVNNEFSSGLNDFETAEDSLFATATTGMKDFTFFDISSVPAMVTGMSFVGSIMSGWFTQAGGASGVGIVLSILFSIMLVAMVLGLYRWYQSKGGKD